MIQFDANNSSVTINRPFCTREDNLKFKQKIWMTAYLGYCFENEGYKMKFRIANHRRCDADDRMQWLHLTRE